MRAVSRVADYRHLLAENVNLVGRNLGHVAVRIDDFDLFHDAVFGDENLADLAVDRAGFRDGFRPDNTDICIQHRFEVAGFIQRQDVFAAGDGDGVAANGDDRRVGEQLYAAIPVLVLDGDSRHGARIRVDDQRLADAQLEPLGDADDWKPQNLCTFFHHECVLPKI